MRVSMGPIAALIQGARAHHSFEEALLARISTSSFCAHTKGGTRGYAPIQPVIRVAGEMAQEIFPRWSGVGADREADQIIKFFASSPKALGHGHRHWAFASDTLFHNHASEPQAFVILGDDGQPMLIRDAQVFRGNRSRLALDASIAAGFYLGTNPYKTLHGFFSDRTLVSDLYQRLLDPRHNTWLREHRRFQEWMKAASDAPLIVATQLGRAVGVVFERGEHMKARVNDAACTDCLAVLRKVRSPAQQPDFYLATAYPVSRRRPSPPAGL